MVDNLEVSALNGGIVKLRTMCVCVCVCIYIYIYIYTHRERETDRQTYIGATLVAMLKT
jgi:hypothetical protein